MLDAKKVVIAVPPCEVQRRHVLRWNLPTPRFTSAPPDVRICRGWDLAVLWVTWSCSAWRLCLPNMTKRPTWRYGPVLQPWLLLIKCITVNFFLVQKVCYFCLGCPSEKERERLKNAENQTSTSKQLELAAVLQAPSSDSRFLHHVWYTSV